jgi:multiple sugar transport system permease protein
MRGFPHGIFPKSPRPKLSKLAIADYKYAFLFIAPMFIGYLIFLAIPLFATLTLSLTNYSLLTAKKFVAFDNYIKLFTNDPVFARTVVNTLYFSVLFVPLSIFLALGLALMLTKNLPGVGLFRTIMFTPYVTTIAVWAIVWKFIFQTDNGAINLILRSLFGVAGPQWLYNEKLSIPVVVITTLLKSVGMNMIIFISALKDVPVMYYEAAELDGATALQKLRRVTLPMISPTIFLITVMSIINSLKVFGLIQVMTEGGPGVSSYVFVYYIYQKAFKLMEFGSASAISVVLFALIMVMTIIQWKLRKKWVHYEV